MMAEEEGVADGCQRIVARAASKFTTALAMPGTASNAAVALRTQLWQFMPLTEKSVVLVSAAGAGGSHWSEQAQLIRDT